MHYWMANMLLMVFGRHLCYPPYTLVQVVAQMAPPVYL